MSRWDVAQSYEKDWRNIRKDKLDLEFYRSFAREIKEKLSGIMEIDKKNAYT